MGRMVSIHSMFSEKDDTEQSESRGGDDGDGRTTIVPASDGTGSRFDRRRFLGGVGGIGVLSSLSGFARLKNGRADRSVVGVSSRNPSSRTERPPAAYSATDLGTLGGAESTATSISRRGYVVGTSQRADLVPHAFLWSERDGMQDLGTLTDRTSRATDINGHCHVVGASRVTDIWERDTGTRTEIYPEHAIRWSREGGMRDIYSSDGQNSVATAINDRGDIVGTLHYYGEVTLEGFVLWADGDCSDRLWRSPRSSSGDFLVPADIDTDGRIVGTSFGVEPVSGDAFMWSEDEGERALGTLGGQEGEATAINDRGQVVGNSQTADGTVHAFVWSPDEGMSDLGTLGGNYSEATDVNDRGQVVGNSQTADGTVHAFIWSPDEGMRDLGTLGGDYSRANGINEREQIVGESRTDGGSPHATLWSRE